MERISAAEIDDTAEIALDVSAPEIPESPAPTKQRSGSNGRVSTSPNGRSAAPPTASPAAPPAASKGWGLPLVVLIAGMFMSILDISIVNVAMSSMQKD